MNSHAKHLMFALGAVVAVQPSQAAGMESAQQLLTNKWVIAATCGLVGYGVQKYAGQYLKNNVFTEKELPLLISADEYASISVKDANVRIRQAATIGKYNKDTGELPDDTTSNMLNFAADVANLKGTSNLGAFLLTNSFNLYRSVETVATSKEKDTWYKDLDSKQAFITAVYAAAGIATAVLPQKLAKDNVWAQAAMRFISRTYLRSKLLQWFTDEKNHKFNKNLADVFDLGLGAYYKA